MTDIQIIENRSAPLKPDSITSVGAGNTLYKILLVISDEKLLN